MIRVDIEDIADRDKTTMNETKFCYREKILLFELVRRKIKRKQKFTEILLSLIFLE